MAATVQRQAAVVSPRTESPERMMAPAPRKPTPATTWAAIRAGSDFPGFRSAMWIDTSMMRHDPRETIMWVRSPAGWLCISRSRPTRPPSRPARQSLPAIWMSAASMRSYSKGSSCRARTFWRTRVRDPRETRWQTAHLGPERFRVHRDRIALFDYITGLHVHVEDAALLGPDPAVVRHDDLE